MQVIRNDIPKPFDVDSTLVFWVPRGKVPPKDAIEVDYYGERVYVVPHYEHVLLLKATMGRGQQVIVWSANGFQWAENVLKALGFGEKDPIIVMSKFSGYVDDIPIGEWAGNRIYIQPQDKTAMENE